MMSSALVVQDNQIYPLPINTVFENKLVKFFRKTLTTWLHTLIIFEPLHFNPRPSAEENMSSGKKIKYFQWGKVAIWINLSFKIAKQNTSIHISFMHFQFFLANLRKKKSRTCTKIKFSTIDLQIGLFASNILTVFLLNYCKRISTRMLKAGACRRSKSKYPYARPPRSFRPTMARPSTCNEPHAGHRPTTEFKCSE